MDDVTIKALRELAAAMRALEIPTDQIVIEFQDVRAYADFEAKVTRIADDIGVHPMSAALAGEVQVYGITFKTVQRGVISGVYNMNPL